MAHAPMPAGGRESVLAPETLLRRWAASRDEAALARVVEGHWGRAYRVARAVVSDASAAEDCAQAALIAVAREAGRFEDRGAGSFAAWLDRIVVNVARKSLRARWRRARHERRVATLEPAAAASDGTAGDDDLARAIRAALDRLPERLRTPLVLQYVEGRSQREIALALGCPQGTVASRIRLGIERLRRDLGAAGAVLAAAAIEAMLAREAGAVEVPPAPSPSWVVREERRAARRSALLRGAAALVLAAALVPAALSAIRPGGPGGAPPSAPLNRPPLMPSEGLPSGSEGARSRSTAGEHPAPAHSAPAHAERRAPERERGSPESKQPSRIAGRALDDAGTAVEGASVVVWGESASTGEAARMFWRRGVTDAGGGFAVEAPESALYRVKVWHPRSGGASAEVAPASAEVLLVLPAEPRGEIAGTIGGERGEALAGVTLTLWPRREGGVATDPDVEHRIRLDDPSPPWLRYGGDGRFALELPAGVYRVEARAPGRARAVRYAAVRAGGEAALDVRLPRVGTLSCWLRPPGGVRPGEAVECLFRPAGAAGTSWAHWVGWLAERTEATADRPATAPRPPPEVLGAYAPTFAPERDFEVRFRLGRGIASETVRVRLAPGEARTESFFFPETGVAVAGRLVDRLRRVPIAGADLVLVARGEDGRGRPEALARTGADGGFAIAGASSEGDFWIEFRPRGDGTDDRSVIYPAARWRVPGAAAERTVLRLELDRSAAVVLVLPPEADRLIPRGGAVRLVLEGAEGEEGEAPSQGPLPLDREAVRRRGDAPEIHARTLFPGSYRIEVGDPPLAVEPERIVLESGVTTRVPLRIREAAAAR